MRPSRRTGYALIMAAAALGLTATCALLSAHWVGLTFPGFFIMANRVVASVSLPHWSVAHHTALYQQAIVAVNGQPVATAEETYAAVQELTPGSIVTYTVAKNEHLSQIALATSVFTWRDYILLFGAYLFTGLTISLTGILVWFLKPTSPASQALFLAGGATGLFGLTGPDLYGPHWFFRLHVLGEAFFPAGYLHLAFIFPVDRLRQRRRFFLLLPYLIAGILSVAYQICLYQPAAYSLIHNLCMVYAGVAGLTMLGKVLWDHHTNHSPLIRQRIRVICLGFLAGYALPVILMLASGLTGGEVAVNYIAFTGFLFPASLGYAVVKHDLFEIDILLKRGIYYLTLTTILSGLYFALLAFLNLAFHASELTRSPLFPLFFTLSVLLLFNPVKERLQHWIDRLFFRMRYDPRAVLETTSASLAATLRLEEILAFLWRTIGETLGVRRGGIFLLAPDSAQYIQAWPPTEEERRWSHNHGFVQALRRQGGVLVLGGEEQERESFSTGAEGLHPDLAPCDAQLMVPLSFKGDLIGFLLLGRKESGAFFSSNDRDFLSTLANQGAVSIANALAYQEIQLLNANLEQKVTARTQELARSNTELHSSLARLERAYQDLQRSQDSLVRAEKMAALGRLTAGIAHEMNTPLGACLTSLKVLQRLLEERRVAVACPTTAKRTPHDIEQEMDKLLLSTQQWMDKAASYMRSLKLHTRDLQRGGERRFSVLRTLEDTALLLSHRLRLSQCTLTVANTAADANLYGDPSKLGQVLTNLIINAIDAYNDTEEKGGKIAIDVSEAGPFLEIRVSDQGCGIPSAHLEKIFDEFFSTKPLGEGTGLGLSISRHIIANFFGGTISVSSTVGCGTTFTLRLPRGKTPVGEQPHAGKSSPAKAKESFKIAS